MVKWVPSDGGQHRGLVGGAVVAADEVDGAPDGGRGEIGPGLRQLAGDRAGRRRRPAEATARWRTCRGAATEHERRRRRSARPAPSWTTSASEPAGVTVPLRGSSQRRAAQRAARGREAAEDAEPVPRPPRAPRGTGGGKLPGLDAGLERGRTRGGRPVVVRSRWREIPRLRWRPTRSPMRRRSSSRPPSASAPEGSPTRGSAPPPRRGG